MCGFVGFKNTPEVASPQNVIKAMADRIIHRGPDDADYYVDDQVSLGFRRLSIIDLEGGRQPILNEDGTKVLVFNGEIYNFQSLREDLLEKGHVFKTRTDSETILHGYEEYGKDILQKLRGMFAFVIWDKEKQLLFGARDIFGIKPFYYYKNGDQFFFGSEIKSFLSHPCFVKELDEEKIPEYLSYEYIPYENTIFKNVYKLPGAHCFTYQDGKLSVERYYKIQYKIEDDKSLEYWEEAIQKEFTESVAMHQISDVEVGCFLSSGVDSSYVVKEISKGTKKVKTFSVGYTEEKYSELPYAQEFSQAVGVPNISNKVSADEFFEAVPLIQYMLDEPLPNPSEIPLYFLAKNARKYVKVVLSGEGADELFGGYPWYHREEILFEDTFPWSRSIGLRLGLLTPDAVRNGEEFVRQHYRDTCDRAPKLPSDDKKAARMREMFVLNLDWFMATLLDRKDRMSMYSGLEVRVPFCDHRIVEYAYNMPWDFKSLEGREKGIVRRAFANELPKEIVYRKKSPYPKTFHPVYTRLCADYVRRIFEDNTSVAASLFDRNAVQKLMQRPESLAEPWFGQLMRTPQIFAYIIQLDRWFRHYHVKIV